MLLIKGNTIQLYYSHNCRFYKNINSEYINGTHFYKFNFIFIN